MNTSDPHPNVPRPGACAMVIVGATGDLTKRLLIPAVYILAAAGLLPDPFAVVGVAIEKPFGHDLDSARVLNRDITSELKESQIYRIDHYLGKETVQNILVFRFANGIFEPIWNRRYIDHVQITVAETVGVEHRGAYYDHAGALRDMVPNHLFQVLTLVAMESPGSFEADAVRDEKVKLLKAVRPLGEEEVLSAAVRGQYDAGEVAGQLVVAYRQAANVSRRFEHRDVRGLQAGDRQLALGGCALLFAHRQVAGAASE